MNTQGTSGRSVTMGLPDWQPIETAPKDGTKILARCQPTYQETGKPMTFDYINVVWWRGEKFKDSYTQWRRIQLTGCPSRIRRNERADPPPRSIRPLPEHGSGGVSE